MSLAEQRAVDLEKAAPFRMQPCREALGTFALSNSGRTEEQQIDQWTRLISGSEAKACAVQGSDQALDRSRPAFDLADGVVPFWRPRTGAESEASAAIDLVYQAAEVLQSIENHAAETTSRAHDLARQATEHLQLAEDRIRALNSAQKKCETDLQAANARADEAEQAMSATEAQIAEMASRVAAAEQRARNAEARAIEAEKSLIRIEDAIRSQLLARRPPVMKKLVAA